MLLFKSFISYAKAVHVNLTHAKIFRKKWYVLVTNCHYKIAFEYLNVAQTPM